MKNLILIITNIAFLGFLSSSQLQGQAFRQGELTISPGVGVVGILSNYNSFPVVVNAEYGLNDYLSAGGFFGLRFLSTNNTPSAINPALGVRVTGHFFPAFNQFFNMAIDEEKVDVYLTLLTGYELTNSNYPAVKDFIAPRPVLGAKYYLSDPIAIWTEVGLGAFSLLTAGVTIRLDK